MVSILVKKKVNLNLRDKQGLTPLMVAATLGLEKITSFLVDRGAARDIKNADGKTAVDLARANHHQKTLEYLERRNNKL